MKKILFYTENFCDADSKGGLEVATYRIAKSLKDRGMEIFHTFRRHGKEGEKSIYSDVVKLSSGKNQFEKQLTDFINRNEIDVVVNMSRFFRNASIKRAVNDSSRKIKMIFMQHFAPGSERMKPTFKAGFHLMKLNPLNPLYWLRASIYPLIKLPRLQSYKGIYKETYLDNDLIVLLSDGYKEDYCKEGGFADFSKFRAIPNIYERESHLKSIDHKEKRVLILSRMDEIQKRLSLALKIWQKIEADPELGEWQLDIVGSGHNTDIVRRLIKKLKLRNVTFHGWQNREKFLERSSILMSTSFYEGLPLSILEARSYGCVPIAFDSYASLHDAVADNINGVIVDRFEDLNQYAFKLKDLMLNNEKRKEMAHNGLENMEKFSSENVGSQWIEMLNGLNYAD